MTTSSQAIFPAPPTSGADLVDRHWAVEVMPASQRAAALSAARTAADAGSRLVDATIRETAHTLATAYELAALLGRDALRSGATGPAPRLEREALRIGAERACLLHRALGLPDDGYDPEALLRLAVRVSALAAVAGPVAISETRAWLLQPTEAQRLQHAADLCANPAADSAPNTDWRLWLIWRTLLLQTGTAGIEPIMADLAALREQRRRVPELAPGSNESELRKRFQAFIRERLADAAGLVAVGLRAGSQADRVMAEITAQCSAARSASTGDPNLDLLGAWLELAALTRLAALRVSPI